MSKFTPVYEKARDVVQAQKYAEPDWQKLLKKTLGIDKLLGPKGFDTTYADAPGKIRDELGKKAHGAFKAFFVGGGVGDVLYNASVNKDSSGTTNERAAALKMLVHLYRAQKKGGQDVWVYSPPKGHTKHVFDEIVGPEGTVKKRLGMMDEIFSAGERDLMCNALSVALKVSQDALVKLDDNKASTTDVVKRWFFDEDSKDGDLAGTITILKDGLKKIAAGCNSASLVFTDYLDWRKQRNDYYGAAFRGGEGGGFPVIYLEGAFTRLKGNSGKLWLCAETIVHEFSHHEVSTQDHRYDDAGLKPNKAAFPYAKAIENADSWGYFILDLAGYLSTSDRNKVLR